jgi:hypothetical protein
MQTNVLKINLTASYQLGYRMYVQCICRQPFLQFSKTRQLIPIGIKK